MAGGNDDDLDLEPIHKGRTRPIVIGVLLVLVGGGVATYVNTHFKRARRVDSIARTATAWNELRRCLVGDQLHGRTMPSALIRRIEITLPRGQRDLPDDERLHRWPYRCATYASVMTHALFDADSDDPNHRVLAMAASRAASALEQGQLRTGSHDPSGYIDELFAAAEMAGLPTGAPATAPLPPTAGHPLTVPQLDALTAGAGTGTFVSSDPVVSASLRVVLGQSQRYLCVFPGSTDAATTLTHVHCASMPFANAPARVEPVAAEDGAVAMVRLANGGTPGDVYLAEGGIAPYVHASVGPWSAPGNVFSTFVAPTAPITAWSVERVRGGAEPVRADVTFPVPDNERTAPVIAGDLALLAVRAAHAASPTSPDASSPDASSVDATAVASADASADGGASAPPGHLLVAAVPAADPPTLTFASVADVVSPERDQTLSVCRSPGQIAVAVHGAWHRTSILFFRDGHWTTPVDGMAQPGAFTCRSGEATFTWMEAVGRRRVHQLRCTPERCTAAEAIPPTFEGDVVPVVADLDGKVVLLASPGPSHGLQMVLAPIDHLAGTEPVVLIDDGEHGGLEIAPALSLFGRNGAAVVILSAVGEPYTSYAIRIDPTGDFRAVQSD